jgi:hypothetical protein
MGKGTGRCFDGDHSCDNRVCQRHCYSPSCRAKERLEATGGKFVERRLVVLLDIFVLSMR